MNNKEFLIAYDKGGAKAVVFALVVLLIVMMFSCSFKPLCPSYSYESSDTLNIQGEIWVRHNFEGGKIETYRIDGENL